MLGSKSAGRDQVDPADALIREVGAQLRQVRLQRGEEVDGVAQHLRIKPAYLSAIEEGDLSAMPGRTYALGFLRSYAGYLGFDGEDLIARIRSSVTLTDRTRLRIRAPIPENRLPRTPMVVISLAVVAGIYVGWSYVNRADRTAIDTVAEVPPDLRDPASKASPRSVGDGSPATEDVAGTTAAAPDIAASPDATVDPLAEAATAAASSDETQAARATAGPATDPGPEDATSSVRAGESPSEGDPLAVQPAAGDGSGEPVPVAKPTASSAVGETAADAPPGSTVDQAEASAAVAETTGAEPVDPARQAVAVLLESSSGAEGAPQVYERTQTDARVILRAREQTWIEVSSPSGDYTFTRTLEPGEALLVPNRQDLELWTGNARGLEIVVDGVPMSLTPGRAVRRNISLDPDHLAASSLPAR
jgi:cytoskeleton protein RodZ